MRKVTILYDGENINIKMNSGCCAEALIILNETLITLCDSLDKPVEQALTIAYSMQDKGELFEELEEENNEL